MSIRTRLHGLPAWLKMIALGGLLLLAGCLEMADQSRHEPLEASAFFDDGQASRPLIEEAVPRGGLVEERYLATGTVGGEPLQAFPFAIDREIVNRGREQYDVYCAPCHGLVGDGQGMIVQRGFPAPPSFHVERLRDAPPGHFVDVMANGLGIMSSYAGRVSPADRWAIAAYIRALQLSQNVPSDQLSTDDLEQLPEREQ